MSQVLFRKENDGNIIAVFDKNEGRGYTNGLFECTSFGDGHAPAQLEYINEDTVTAAKGEYAELLKFVDDFRIGQDLDVVTEFEGITETPVTVLEDNADLVKELLTSQIFAYGHLESKMGSIYYIPSEVSQGTDRYDVILNSFDEVEIDGKPYRKINFSGKDELWNHAAMVNTMLEVGDKNEKSLCSNIVEQWIGEVNGLLGSDGGYSVAEAVRETYHDMEALFLDQEKEVQSIPSLVSSGNEEYQEASFKTKL